MDADDAALLTAFSRLMQQASEHTAAGDPRLTQLGELIREHLGTVPTELPTVTERFPPHRLVDVDIALDELAGDEGEIVGVRGGQHLRHEDFAGHLASTYAAVSAGPVAYVSVPSGPRTSRRTVARAVRLFRFDGAAVALFQRAADPEYGRNGASVEILTDTPDRATALVGEIHRLMNERSIVRGNVVSFSPGEYGESIVGGMAFLERPVVPADEVILPDGLLDRIRAHVVGIGERADALRARGQHLKRGILMYGPPGTGKTLTVRHLLHATPGTTAVLLQGSALQLIGEAARLARAMSPAIVVLEDVDLVAAERGDFGLQPLLFEVLDALDGLDGDADVAFLLTTNRAEILEPALAARPGRVDLAIEVPLPDLNARKKLFQVYGGELPFSAGALDAAAEQAEGITASFVKEVVRRAVLAAVTDDREVGDADLGTALNEMLESTRGISRVLFGGQAAEDAGGEPDAEHVGSFAYVPLHHH